VREHARPDRRAGGSGPAVVRLPRRTAAQYAILEVLVMQMLVGAVAERRALDVEEFVFHHSDTKVSAPAPTA
jgi:hypothetical protein